MGAPSITISFIEKAMTAVTRGERGIVMLWVKDTLAAPAVNPVTVVTEKDIPDSLKDATVEQIKLAMIGYTNAPKKVIVYCMGIADDAEKAAIDVGYKKAMEASETIKFNYLAIPTVETDQKVQEVATWVKTMRDVKKKKIKAVLPNTAADNEGIINYTTETAVKTETVTAKNGTKTTVDTKYTAEQYCARIAGLIAGTPMTIACTYAPLSELSDCTRLTDIDTPVDKGEFIVFYDGEKVKVARGVNSFVTTVDGKQGGKITMTTEQKTFIENIAAAARKHAANYGIAVISPIIAQAINESGWGKSTLAAKYHNYFGMKCGSAWKGKSVNMSTCEEYEVGVLTQIKDNFRVYDSLEEGVKGYFDFISASRYANLKGVTDPKTYIENIKADGYATSSQYVKNLLNLVSAYNLTQYDNITAQQGKKSVAEIAQEVIAGAWGNGTERKEKLEAAGYNYAEVQAIVNERAGNKTENKVDNKKSIAEIAQEVVAGKWGNGSERKQRLEAEGYDYAEVQATVNNIMGKSQPNKKNVAEIANEVISGKWGNGSERKEKLEAAGYNYTAAAVVKALDRLERKTGAAFRKIFKTITVDNGSEFADWQGMERSKRNKKNRTKVYYCHPYSSWERGSNENQNKLVRRHIPKGVNFDDKTQGDIDNIAEWINNYPRRLFEYQSAEKLYNDELKKIAA